MDRAFAMEVAEEEVKITLEKVREREKKDRWTLREKGGLDTWYMALSTGARFPS